jgi:hypothetical protein
VAGQAEEDHALLSRVAGGDRLVDRSPNGVGGFGRRHDPLRVGELHGGIEHGVL